MITFLETDCIHCGSLNEADFVLCGPHLKQICADCGRYVKFFSKALLPELKAIRNKIWAIANEDKETIAKAKKEVGFIDGLTGLEQKVMHWKLYMRLREPSKKIEPWTIGLFGNDQ